MRKSPLKRKIRLTVPKPTPEQLAHLRELDRIVEEYEAKQPKPKKIQKKKSSGPSVAVLDNLFSQYIRRNGECQLWGFGGIPCSTQLQCSHIHSRRFHSVRWDEGNAICACAAHHRWQHDHPHLSTWALEEILGKDHLESLRDRFLNGRKPTPDQKVAIAEFLRAELRKAA